MIAAVSSFSGHLEDVRNTLKYANRAKNIKIELTKKHSTSKTRLKRLCQHYPLIANRDLRTQTASRAAYSRKYELQPDVITTL